MSAMRASGGGYATAAASAGRAAAARTALVPVVAVVAVAVAAAACWSSALAQIIDTPDEEIAGIPVNYQEAEVGLYTLPDPLVLESGERVRDAQMWRARRRPEILALLEAQQFGKAPGRPPAMTFDVFDEGAEAYGGKALRKQVAIYFSEAKTDNYIELLMYFPSDAQGPVPVLLQLGWGPNNLAVVDPGVKVGRAWDARTKTRSPATTGRALGGPFDVLRLVERGYGVAMFNYNDVEPDSLDSLAYGVRSLYLPEGATEPEEADEWGAVAAWAWSVSRIVDYFETDADVDARRIAITGASRLGKTALWAGARDERIAAVIASVSGEGGAALSRRDYGETVAHLVAPTRYPYWYARNYADWAGRMAAAPFDAHFILALVAPRPLLLQTGYTDKWSDPYGEFLAAKAATPVYALLGATGIEQYSQPALGEPLTGTLGFLMHDGGHGVAREDWDVFLDFLDRYL